MLGTSYLLPITRCVVNLLAFWRLDLESLRFVRVGNFSVMLIVWVLMLQAFPCNKIYLFMDWLCIGSSILSYFLWLSWVSSSIFSSLPCVFMMETYHFLDNLFAYVVRPIYTCIAYKIYCQFIFFSQKMTRLFSFLFGYAGVL